MPVSLYGTLIGFFLFNRQGLSLHHLIIICIVGLAYVFEKWILDKKKIESIQLILWLKVFVYLICSIAVSTLFINYFSADISELLPSYFGLALISMVFGMMVYYSTKKEIKSQEIKENDNL